MTTSLTRFALRIGPLGPPLLVVRAFRGTEALNALYDFRIEVSTSVPAPLFERLVLGTRATLYLRVAGHDRQVHGIIAGVRAGGRHVGGMQQQAHFTVRLVPEIWLFTRRTDSRIFQDLRVDEIVDQLLQDPSRGRQLPARWALETERPKRQYTTQHEESDLAFVRRLVAENAILFYFDQPKGIVDSAVDVLLSTVAPAAPLEAVAPALAEIAGLIAEAAGLERPREKICFTDHASYPPIEGSLAESAVELLGGDEAASRMPAPALPYGSGSSTAEDFVFDFRVGRAIRTTRAAHWSYDPDRPLSTIKSEASRDPFSTGDLTPEAIARTLTEFLGGSVPGVDASSAIADLERYTHDERDLYPNWAYTNAEPNRSLAQHRRKAVSATGRSTSARLTPGRRFALEGHPHLGVDGSYVVTSIQHRGVATGAESEMPYTNSFECVPAAVAFVPPRPRRRSVQVCLTATVVGPPGDDIYVNQSGQIKVRFHWDRRGDLADPTCWLRAMQAWGGASWGSQFIPRVGMEVVVAFEGGDPDKPIVLGSVYNGTHPMPFATPRDKTRSGFRSRSSPSGGGNNELSFEDKAGAEQIYVHAERDWDSEVRRDRTARIGADDHLVVAGSRTTQVTRDTTTNVGGQETATVHGDRSHRVEGTETETFQAVHVHVGKSRATSIEERDRLEVKGDAVRVVHGDDVSDVRGALALVVGRSDKKRAADVLVEGPIKVAASEIIDISSDKEIILRVGCSFISIKSGSVEIGSSKVEVRGKDARLLLADGESKTKAKSNIQLVSDDMIVLKSSGASLGLKSEAKLDGSQVLLNSPTAASDTIEASSIEPTKIELVDDRGNPIPYERYRIVLEDGTEMTGFLDGEGKAEVEIESEGALTFPNLTGAARG